MGCTNHGNEPHDHDHEGHEHAEETGSREESAEHGEEIHLSEAQMKASGVVVSPVQPTSFTDVIHVSGQIQSPLGQECTVVAPMSGVITFADHSMSDGAMLRNGQTIAHVSARQLQDGDPIRKARIELESAEREYVRAKALVADHIISQKEFENIRARYELAKAAMESHATQKEGGMSVHAPTAGYVKNRLVAQGAFVNMGDPILTITQNRKLQLRADVPERLYAQILQVRGAHFRTPGNDVLHKLEDLDGRLVSYGKNAEGNGGFLPVTFEFNHIGNILPGSFADIYLLAQPHEQAIAVPLTAITEEQGFHFVYVEVPGEPGCFTKRIVTLGSSDGERTEILEGLEAGERIAAEGACRVRLAAASPAIPHGHTH